jgi:hypothetical protein
MDIEDSMSFELNLALVARSLTSLLMLRIHGLHR